MIHLDTRLFSQPICTRSPKRLMWFTVSISATTSSYLQGLFKRAWLFACMHYNTWKDVHRCVGVVTFVMPSKSLLLAALSIRRDSTPYTSWGDLNSVAKPCKQRYCLILRIPVDHIFRISPIDIRQLHDHMRNKSRNWGYPLSYRDKRLWYNLQLNKNF